MAFGVRAYWQSETNNSVTDRIEIQEDGFAGTSIQLEANSEGFRYRLSEITSESDDGLINPLANKIQVGKLTFFPKIVTTAEETLLDDILGSPDNTFRIVWKQDGSVNWTGYVDNKKRSYPETGGLKFTEIRASDFDLLKAIDYPLDDTRQTLITTIADLFGYLDFGYNIRTATSWITEDTTDSTDFLSQIYHETRALRVLPRTGDESARPISVWDALIKVGDPALLFRQVNGEFTVEQLSAFTDPENVYETLYDSDGVVDTTTATVDRRLTGYTSADAGNLVVKRTSQNDLYPAIKRAKVTFEHRNRISGIQFPDEVEFTDSDSETYEASFISDGNQTLQITGIVRALMRTGATDATAGISVTIVRDGLDDYYLDETGDNWITSGTSLADLELTNQGGDIWQDIFDIETPETPADADGVLRITIQSAVSTSTMPGVAHTTFWRELNLDISNINNSVSTDYQLTQDDGYSINFELSPTWFGDGPNVYSVSALRYGDGDDEVTETSWQRRGTTTGYRKFHENLLKEVLDLQRSNVRKLNAEFWGQYNPSKILVYDGNSYYCAGVSYVGNLGRWSANLFRINTATASDTFEDIVNFDTSVSTGTSVGVLNAVSNNLKFSNSQKITTTTSSLSGTITSIPIVAVGEQFLEPGDIFYLFNLSTASLTEFTLDSPQLASDTALTVESTALNETIVSGSWVVFTGDQIGSYRTQSDTAIRLGVRDYAQAVTPQNDAYMMTVQTDELQSGDTLTASDITDSGFTVNFSEPDFQVEDVPWAFATNGDQTALDQGLSSEIALLAGQIVLKTAGSGIAQVRLDSRASTGSLIELTADNIEINSVVTKINASATVEINASSVDIDGILTVVNAGGTVGIDGGVVQASSAVVVGSGANSAGLTGADDTILIYAGAETPNAAPFRVTKDGSTYATKFVQLSGETVDGVIEHFSIQDLKITGELTNEDNDFTIDSNGYSVAQSVGLNISRSYALDEGNKGALYCTSGAAILDSIAGTDLLIRANGVGADLRLFAETDIELLADAVDIQTDLKHTGSNVGFFNTTPVSQRSISNLSAPVEEVIDALVELGLVTDDR